MTIKITWNFNDMNLFFSYFLYFDIYQILLIIIDSVLVGIKCKLRIQHK